jgi:FtsH-binding integral membrane protein
VTGGLADACCVAAFVVIGRASHTEGETLAGLAVGWLATRAWRRPTAVLRTGVGVWLSTVALGMVLRVVSGQGAAAAFVVVALAFLGLFMLGWRVVAGRFATAWPG